MKIKSTHTLLFLFSLLLASVSFAQSPGDYQSVASGNWNNTGTWARYDGASWVTPAPSEPTSTDGVITILNTHTVTVGVAAAADQIIVATGGALTVNSTLTVDGTGTNLTVNGAITALGTLNGTGEMVVNGTMDWTGGTLAIATNLAATATCNMYNATRNLNTTLTVTNGAVVNWSDFQVNFNDGTFTNNGTINITHLATQSFNNVSGTNLFTNGVTGVITKSAGAVQTNIGVPFVNNGTINVNTGTFRKPAPGNMTNTGTINIASGALVSIAFTVLDLEPGTVLAGAGALQIFSTGTSNVNLPLTVPSGFTFRLASNTLAGSGSIAVDGIFDFFGGTLSVPTTINSTGSMITSDASAKNLNTNLVVDGTFTWTLGSFTLTSAAITINGSMVANLASSQFINSSVAGSSLTISNGATLSKTSTAASTFTSNISITNNGIMSGIGTLNFTGANGPIVNAGEVRPGNSPGILGLNANLITGQTPTLRIEILGPASTAGVDFDQLTFNTGAAIDVSGTTLIVVEDDVNAPATSFTIMNNTGAGAFTGNFAAVVIPLGYSITYNPGVSTSIVVTKLGSTLPAVWGNFNALAKNNNRVTLNWSTLQENNVSHYTIEYSVNGRDYTGIGTVAAAGNSSDVSNYSFVHNTPDVQKTNYYRIRQSDLDGKIAYSAIRPVRFSKGTVTPILVTPNPVRDRLQLSVQAENIRIMLVDMSGRTLKNMNLQPGNHELGVAELAPGMYHLVIFQDGLRLETQKIIKQ